MSKILDEKPFTDHELASAYAEGRHIYEREGISVEALVESMTISSRGGYLPLLDGKTKPKPTA